jgi:hypothetical protein
VASKRGQVTLFVAVGIVIVLLIGITLYSTTNLFLINPTKEDLNEELDAIRTHVQDCILESVDGPLGRPIIKAGLQGGYLAPSSGTYRLYNDNLVSYLCYNMEDTEQCMSRMLLRSNIEDDITAEVTENIAQCMDVQGFRRFGGFDIITGAWNVKTDIGKDRVNIMLDYPITLKSKRSDAEVSQDEFSRTFNYPLGDLYDVANTILDFETEFGEFDQFAYMLSKKGLYKIEKKKPYPDKLYVISRRDAPSFVFQFFVQGEQR